MSYSHPLASLSAAAAAVLPIPVPSRSSSTSSPAQQQQSASGNHSQMLNQYYNQSSHSALTGGGGMPAQGTSSGQGGIVHSPDSIDSPHSVADTKKGRKRKASHGTGGGNKEDEKDAAAKKRQVVSCGECKRRKIKCSRTHPCLACCKRGEPEACRWDQEAIVKPDTQPFAISSDLLLLADRVQALEKWARSLPDEMGSTAPEVKGFTPTFYGNKTKKGKGIGAGGGQHHEGPGSATGTITREGTESPMRAMSVERDERKSLPLGDTEDAVIKLESVAFDQRLPGSRYRPVDSLPFFDNIPNTRLNTSQSSSHRREASITANNEGDHSALELTRGRTSILASPLSFEGPFSGPSLGLPLVSSLDDLKAAKSRELEGIFKLCPDKELSHRLVNRYFLEVDWLLNIFYEPIFQAEHERYWEMRESGRGDEIDPMWLACYCMVLALGVDGLRCETPQDQPTFEERKMYRPTWWYGCALRLIQLGDSAGRPQIRFIQVVILIGQWLAFSTTGGHASRCLSLLGQAMRTAQILGLHQMSSDPSQMPPPDPAYPPGANSIKREGAIRLYGFLVFLDYMSATTRFKSYLLDPLQCTTPAVSNINLDQLSSTDWRFTQQPRNVYTDGSFEWAKWRVAQASREAFSRLVLQPSTFSYETVLELDSKFREVLREISIALPIEGAPLTRPQQWKRLVCLEGVHSRIVRLHRPFLLKKDFSRKTCLESAEMVIKSQVKLQKWTNNIWFIYNHSLAAATALFADLFDAIDHDLPERQIEAKKEILVLAFEIFSKHDDIASPSLRHVVQTGSRILSGLFMAEEKRRVTRAANALVGGGARSNSDKTSSPSESFAQVLQRLTLELDIPRPILPSPAPVASRPLPPPTIPADYSNNSLHPSTASAQPFPIHYASTPSTAPQYLPLDPGSFDFNHFPISTTAPNHAALPGMVGNESISSDFWKDGLGLGFGVGGGMGEMGVNGTNGNDANFDFWDLSTPGTGTSAGVQQSQQSQQQQTDYMINQGGGGYDWSGQGIGQGGGGGAVGENRRAAEVMADQLMSSGW